MKVIKDFITWGVTCCHWALSKFGVNTITFCCLFFVDLINLVILTVLELEEHMLI
jgi:hypothetical protein